MPTENDRWRTSMDADNARNPLRLESAGEDSPVRASETRGPWLDWSAAVVVEQRALARSALDDLLAEHLQGEAQLLVAGEPCRRANRGRQHDVPHGTGHVFEQRNSAKVDALPTQRRRGVGHRAQPSGRPRPGPRRADVVAILPARDH